MTTRGGEHRRLGACLSLSGRYARFGTMAASGLQAWAAMRPEVALSVEDDRSEPELVRASLRRLAARSDILLGPYSTGLTREACAVAAEEGFLLWNHGGAGDDVQTMSPGHVVSVLTPASRYATPFIERLGREPDGVPLVLLAGRGRFGRQVVAGAQSEGRRLGRQTTLATRTSVELPDVVWDLLCAGSFEEDVATVRWARGLPQPPRSICAVAAGVRDFGHVVGEPAGIHGLAQWFPGGVVTPDVGLSEAEFVAAYRSVVGAEPDYPAVQAAAASELARHCCAIAGSAEPAPVWRAASRLQATTFFGAFAVDPSSGLQTAHRTILVRWTDGGVQRLEPGAAPA